MSSTAVTTCSRCGRQYSHTLKNGETYKFPDGWSRHDFNDIGFDPTNVYDLCPFCTNGWKKIQEDKLRGYATEHVAPQFNTDED